MTTRLYLVRHGATALSAEDRFAGATDVALSEEGRSQAEHLALQSGLRRSAPLPRGARETGAWSWT